MVFARFDGFEKSLIIIWCQSCEGGNSTIIVVQDAYFRGQNGTVEFSRLVQFMTIFILKCNRVTALFVKARLPGDCLSNFSGHHIPQSIIMQQEDCIEGSVSAGLDMG